MSIQAITEIKRVDTYNDNRFSPISRIQHGCFLADGQPYELEIISETEAIIRGKEKTKYSAVIDEFRFYSPHICKFYDSDYNIVKKFPSVNIFGIPLEKIQPSQFYVDKDKIEAVSRFIHKADDIIIPVMPYGDRYISLDGHTRLYCAVVNKWQSVRAVTDTSDDLIFRFVAEAQKRNIYCPNDIIAVNHSEYEEKWNKFCDDLFALNTD